MIDATARAALRSRAMWCGACGSRVEEGSLLCLSCGAEVEERPAPQRPAVPTAASAPEEPERPPCATHPARPLLGSCPRCGRPVCVDCAPEALRDRLTCAECLTMRPEQSAAPAGATCAVHADRRAAFICSRCGSFGCAACSAPESGLCLKCAPAGIIVAGIGERFVANLIDNAVIFGPPLVAMVMMSSRDFLRSVVETSVLLPLVLPFVVGAGLQVASHLWSAQSIGKRLFRIRVVDLSGEPVTLLRLVFLRNGVLVLLSAMPTVGWVVRLVDALSIFSDTSRCLHDHIAGTRVVAVIGDRPATR